MHAHVHELTPLLPTPQVHANPCSRLGAPGEAFAVGIARLRSTVTAWVRSNERAAKEKAAKKAAAAAARGGDGSEDGGSDGGSDGGGGSDGDGDAPKAQVPKKRSTAARPPPSAAENDSLQGNSSSGGEGETAGTGAKAAATRATAEDGIGAEADEDIGGCRPRSALARARAPYWVDVVGTPLARRGFSLKTAPAGRLAPGTRAEVTETRTMMDGALRGCVVPDGRQGEEGVWMTLIMRDGGENARLADGGGECGGGSACSGAESQPVELVAEGQAKGGAFFVF